jgi:hypothetical protein
MKKIRKGNAKINSVNDSTMNPPLFAETEYINSGERSIPSIANAIQTAPAMASRFTILNTVLMFIHLSFTVSCHHEDSTPTSTHVNATHAHTYSLLHDGTQYGVPWIRFDRSGFFWQMELLGDRIIPFDYQMHHCMPVVKIYNKRDRHLE